MLAKIYKELLVIILIFLGAWYAFILLRPAPEIDFSLSIENERDLSEHMADQIIEDLGGTSDNEDHLLIIDSIQERLTSFEVEHRFEYQIHLVNSAQINAFAAMGGHIFVTEGIMEFCETPEELAAIIAHEMGHVQHRHVLSKLSKDLGMAVLVMVSSGGDPSILAEVINHTLSTSFSRKYEEEADDFGLSLLEESHIKPIHMAAVFMRLKTHIKDSSVEVPELFSTHPDLSSRIDNAVEYQVAEEFHEIPFGIEMN